MAFDLNYVLDGDGNPEWADRVDAFVDAMSRQRDELRDAVLADMPEYRIIEGLYLSELQKAVLQRHGGKYARVIVRDRTWGDLWTGNGKFRGYVDPRSFALRDTEAEAVADVITECLLTSGT